MHTSHVGLSAVCLLSLLCGPLPPLSLPRRRMCEAPKGQIGAVAASSQSGSPQAATSRTLAW